MSLLDDAISAAQGFGGEGGSAGGGFSAPNTEMMNGSSNIASFGVAPTAMGTTEKNPMMKPLTFGAAPTPAGGNSYLDAISFYNQNAASNQNFGYGGEGSGSFGSFTPATYDNLPGAQTDFLNALKGGSLSGVSIGDLAALGFNNTNEIVGRNQTGDWGADPLYGATGYKNLATTLGQSLGLSDQQIASAIGGNMAGRYQTALQNGLSPFELGNTSLGTDFVNALYGAAGKTADSTALGYGSNLDAQFAQQRAIKGNDGGVMGSDFYKWAALMAAGGLGAAYFGPGEAASVGLTGSGDVAGFTAADSAAAAGGNAAAGAGAFDATGSLGTGLASGSVPSGAVTFEGGTWLDAAGNAVGQSTGVGASGAQVLDPVMVSGSGATPLYGSLGPALATIPPAALNSAMNQMPNTDQSKWSLGDWQTYLKLASAASSLMQGGGGGGAPAPAPAPATQGSIQVPTVNPFTDINAAMNQTSGNGGMSLLQAAAAPKLAPTDYTGSPTAVPAVTAPGVGNGFQNAGFTAATPQGPVTSVVAPDQTVADQLTRLLATNSPLIDQARQRAILAANARGLQNSSIAGQGGEEAAISQALPIAQQDASTYLNQSQRNQQAAVQAQQLNEQARQSDNSVGMNSQSLIEQARQANMNAEQNNAKLQEQAREFNLTGISNEKAQQLDADTKTYLANTEAQYKTQTQTTAGASDLLANFNNQVTTIMLNADMDAGNKQAAINNLSKMLQTSMGVLGKVNGLNLSSLLTFA